MDFDEKFRPTTLTLPVIFVGTLLGSLVCATNMHFGLQIGTLNTMTSSTCLMAFAIFRTTSEWFPQVFTPTENVVLKAIASSIASMPIAASLWSIIPAFEYLRRPEEGGERRFTIFELILWSLGVCLFGTVFSAPFRTYFILRQRLRFPGAYATGVLIGVLHNDHEVARIADLDKKGLLYLGADSAVDSISEDADEDNSTGHQDASIGSGWGSKVRLIIMTFSGTAFYVRDLYWGNLLERTLTFSRFSFPTSPPY